MKIDRKLIDKRIRELVEDINDYVSDGMEQKKAIELVRKSTMLNDKHFEHVVNMVDI